MSIDTIIKDLQNKKYAPVYFLSGDEPYFIDKVSDYIESNVLNEAEKAFNQIVIYGKDAEFKSIVDECRQYPMMASRRVVVIKEAQDMSGITELHNYIEKPAESSILVLCYKYNKLDKRTKFAKALEKNAVIFESKKLYDDKIAPFVIEYVRSKGFNIKPEAADLVSEFVGTELSRVANELDKLCVGRSRDSIIEVTDIYEEIGMSREYSVFNLQSAIAERSVNKIIRIIRNFIDNPKNNPEVAVISALYSFFYKVFIVMANSSDNDVSLQKKLGLSSAFFVAEYRKAVKNYSTRDLKRIFSALKTADMHTKGMGARNMGPDEIYKDLFIALVG